MRAYYFFGRLLRPFMIVGMYSYSHLFHTPRARVVVRNEDGELLLVLSWLNGDKWEFPGGGVGRNEDAASGAAREVREEVGITLQDSSLKPLFQFPSRGHDEVVFLANIRKSDLPSELPHKYEIKDARWFAFDALPSLDTPAQAIVAQLVKNS